MLKRIYLLLLILSIALFACTSTTEEATVVPEPTATAVVEPTAAAAEVVEEAPVDIEPEASDTTYTIDPATSLLTWSGSKPIGDSHTGTIDLASGELVLNGDELISGQFIIDMTTIAESEGTARLEGHLASDDFFGVTTYPEAMLEIVSVEAGDSAETYNVTANLTIKETTNEITFPVNVTISADQLIGSASIVFDRSLWDIQYNSGAFFSGLGDDLISDEIELEITIVANS